MAESPEQAELRRHLAELRKAASSLRHDLYQMQFAALEDKIARMPQRAGEELEDFYVDVRDDFGRLGRSLDDSLSKVPGHIENVGSAIAAAAIHVGSATKDAARAAGHATKEKTKDTFASIAGVKRTPMKEWHTPSSAAAASADKDDE